MSPRLDDEFTNSKSNNDSFISSSEYGNLQDSEFSDSGEMHLHKAGYDASLMKSQSSNTNTKVVEDVTQGTSTAIEVTASSTASGVAASSVGVIAATSTLVVGTLTILTGLSIVHDYEFRFENLQIEATTLQYELYINDKAMTEDDFMNYYKSLEDSLKSIVDQDFESVKEEKMPFIIKVYNDNYSSIRYLDYFENSGIFADLILGEHYNIVVSENITNGEIIFKDEFVTRETKRPSTFTDFEFPVNVDIKEQTFEVYMDFIDDNDAFSDFVLYLYDLEVPEELNYTFELDKIAGYQQISLTGNNSSFDMFRDWGYKFTYKNEGELVEYDEGTAVFKDMYSRVSEFNSLEFDKKYSYLDNTMDLKLDYVDDFDWFNNFVFTLTAHYGQQDATSGDGTEQTEDYQIELAPTTDVQTIDITEYEVNLETQYTYQLSCYYRGEYLILAEETTPFYFTDSSGAKSEFNGFIFDQSYNYFTDIMEVRLDFVDDFGYYSNFILHMHAWYEDNGQDYSYDFDIALDSVTTVQEIELTEYEVNMETPYSYELTCSYRGNDNNPLTLASSSQRFYFTDNSGAKTEFYAFEFDKTANFIDRTFEVRLDFDDDYERYSDFELTLYPQDQVNRTYTFPLERTTDVQTVEVEYDYEFDLFDFDYHFTYELTVEDDYETITLAQSDEEFQFTDISGGVSEFYSFDFDGTYDFHTGNVRLKLNYVDDFNYYHNFTFTLTNFDDPDEYYDFEISGDTDEQVINIYDADISVEETWWTYKLTAEHDKLGLLTLAESGENEEFMWTDPNSVTDPDSVSVTFVNNEINYADRSLWVQLDYRDDYDRYDNFVLTFFGRNREDLDDFSNTEDVELQKTKEPQKISIEGWDNDYSSYSIDFIHYDLAYNLYWYESTYDDGYDHYLFGDEESYEEITLTNSAITAFRGAESNFEIYKETVGAGTADEYEQYVMWINFDYIDENGCYSDLHTCFQPVDYDGYLVVADLYYSDDRVPTGWYKYTVGPNSGEVFENGEGICDGQEWLLVVEGWNDTDPYDEYEEGNMSTIYSQVCTPTYVDSPTPTVYGVDFSRQVTAGDGYLDIYPLFAGSSSDFTNVQLILEDESNNVYTYSISVLSEYMGIDLADDDDASVSDVYDCFNSDHTFTITWKYAYASDPTNIITMVLGEDIQFEISVQQN